MRTVRSAAAAAAAIAVLALAGCGRHQERGVATAGGTAHGGRPSPTASVDRNDQLRTFAQCVRDHGVNMTDPDANGGLFVQGKVDTDKLNAANQACRSLLPDGGRPPKFSPEQVDALRTFAACLRSYGLDVPDPDPVTGLIPIADLAKIDRTSQQFKDAEAACRDIRPSFLPGGTA